MPTCPKGHESVATDYCDECGTPMGGHQPPAVAVPAGPSAGQEAPCPQCGTARSGRFCEVCGHDFVLGGLEPAPAATPAPSTAPPTAASTTPSGAPATGSPTAPSAVAAVVEAQPPLLPKRDGRPLGWRAVVVADRQHYERMQAAAVPEAPVIPFPAFCPERRFPLSSGQVLIGRRSAKRGIEPQIDLTGPPEDAAVSHMHAVLVPGADGGWSVVDLDSANGTYLNDSGDQLEPHTPVPLHDGDRIHVGAWTTLTVQREETAGDQ